MRIQALKIFGRALYRKIIAAPKQAYEKLGGVSADTDWFKECDEYKPPQKKIRCKGKGKRKMEEGVDDKLDEVMKKLDSIERKISIFDELKKSFECCICKLPCQSPIVAKCCGQMVGCAACVDHWMENETTCPLCRASCIISQRFALKGFDEITSLFRMLDGPGPSVQADSNLTPVVIETDSEGGDDFEQLPSFRTPSRSTRGNSARLHD